MKTKHLLMLIVLSVVMILLGIWLQRERTISSETVSLGLLVPGLKDAINEVNAIRVIKPGNKTVFSIARIDDRWQVKEKDDYTANVGKIRELLLKISQARITEQKTSNPDLYKRLAVQDIGIEDDESRTRQLEIEGLNNSPVRLIIGGTPSNGADATYVRHAGEESSWLVNVALEIDGDPLNWLDRTVMDIPPEQVYRITINHKGSQPIVLQRTSADDLSLILQNIPQGRKQATGVGNTVAVAIAGLSFEDVAQASKFDIDNNSQSSIRYETFDGLVIDAVVFADKDINYVHFNVSFDAARAKQFEQGKEVPASDDVEKQAASLYRKLSGWAYVIPDIAYDAITKTLENFLVPMEIESEKNETIPEGVKSSP